jgi:hypothetical protein
VISLSFRERWAGVNGYLSEEFDQIVASIQAKWNPQHTDTGAHRDVTADSLTTSRVTLTDPASGASYSLYVSGGTLYIVAGTGTTGGTVVGTQT